MWTLAQYKMISCAEINELFRNQWYLSSFLPRFMCRISPVPNFSDTSLLIKWYSSFTDYLSPWTNSIKGIAFIRAFKLKVWKVITAKMKMFLFEGEIIYPLKSRVVTFHQCSRRVWELEGHKLWVSVGSTTIRTQIRECRSINAIIPNNDDIKFIKENNLADKESIKNLKDEKREQLLDSKHVDANFFVNTKFHFENNSWTWTNGGQINAEEWLAVEGRRPIHPIIPIKVL